MAGKLRALFVSEANLGVGVMGHEAVHRAIRAGLSRRDDVEARYVALPPMRLASRVLTRDAPLLAALDLDLQPVRWHIVQSLRARSLVRSALGAGPADVLHVNSHSIALALGEEMRAIPTFLSVDATIEQWQSFGIWREFRRHSHALLAPSLTLERRALSRATKVLAWTPWAAEGVRRASPEADVHVHSPGVDLHRFRPAVRRPRARPRVLFVGGRFVEKGGNELLAALEPLLGRVVDLDLVTPAQVRRRDGVAVHRLSGDSPELVDLYQQADVFCLPTWADSLGWVVVEAMACGTPVIATAVGGIPDVLEHGRAGVLIPSPDPQTLRDEVLDLIRDGARRQHLAAAGRAVCERRFDANKQTDELVSLMHSAAER